MKKPLRVLMVEDSEDDALLLARELRRNDYDVTFEQVDTPSAMIIALKKRMWDIVVADYVMPQFSGLEALKLMREAGLDLPFIIVSGKIGEDTAVAAMKAGAHDYIMKNNLKRLAAAVERELQEAQIRRDRRRTEELLQASKESFRNIVEKGADGIIIVDKHGIVRFINPVVETFFDRKAKEITSEPFGFTVVAGEVMEIDIIRQNGQAGIAEMSMVETEWEGGVACLASLRDITERKQAEEALRQLDKMKSEFIANVSHELRTPLQSILGFTKLMLRGEVTEPDRQKEFLAIIDNQGEHLTNLINDLVDVSRIESGRFDIQKESLSIGEVIHIAVQELYNLAGEKGIAIVEDLSTELPVVEADGYRLKQVMVNLLSNAIKFSNEGSEITMKAEGEHGDILVQVSDSGIGIPAEAVPHLFERFYQVDGSMSRSAGGSGLGLYISKQIVEAHGGRIWVQSIVDKGSTFSFTVPTTITIDERTLKASGGKTDVETDVEENISHRR